MIKPKSTVFNTIWSWCFVVCMGGVLTACGSSGGNSPSTAPLTNTPSTPEAEQRISLPNTEQNSLTDALSATDAVQRMGIGINLGNTLDAPYEGDWALAGEEYYIEAFKNAGFKHVRIPITWGNHIDESSPYQIDPEFLDRVETIVNWVLSRDMIAIINVHHDEWIKSEYDSVSNLNRFDSIWIQVSERFKHASSDLIFEIINEPKGLTEAQVNELNKRALSIIRNETSNRLVVFAGNEWSGIDPLLATENPDPTDPFLIGNFHSYDPWQFAGICTQPWGSDLDKENLRNIYVQAYEWSVTNNVPVMVNEFGSAKYDFQNPENVCDQSQREEYLRAHVQNAFEFGLAGTFWDDGGSFSTYDRATNTWGPEMQILTGN